MQISSWASMCMLFWSRYFDTMLYFYFFFSFEEVILISVHRLCDILTLAYTAMNESAPNGDGKCTYALFFPIRHVWKSLAFERLKCYSVEFLCESLLKIQCNQQHCEQPFTHRPVHRRLLKLKHFKSSVFGAKACEDHNKNNLMSVNMDHWELFSCVRVPDMLTCNQKFTYIHTLMFPGFTR